MAVLAHFRHCNYLTERDTDAVYPIRAKAAMTKRENDIELQYSNEVLEAVLISTIGVLPHFASSTGVHCSIKHVPVFA